MGRSAILYTVMAIALLGGTIVVLVWWSLADKFFPGAARSTGQGLPRGSAVKGPKPTVVKLDTREPPHPPAAA